MTNFVKKIAKTAYQKHTFIKEWQVFIAIAIVLKVAAMVFSIFAGYFYFNSLFFSILNNTFQAGVFSVVALVIIEILTSISLSKFFKFALRMELKTAVPIFILSCFFFAISFVSSTNGLALRQSQKIDNSAIISEQYNSTRENINHIYDVKKEEVRELIATEKANPQGWTNGKRSTLTSKQLAKIDLYYNNLREIDKAERAELTILKQEHDKEKEVNNMQMSSESDKYYKAVSFIMVLIFLVNGMLMFFYSKVFNENELELQKIEVIKNFSDNILDKSTRLIEGQIQDTFAMYFQAMQGSFDKKKENIVKQNEPKPVGFKSLPLTSVVNDKHITEKQEEGKKTVLAPKSEKRICENCGNSFTYKAWNQKFCSTKCRVDNWEVKHNKTLNVPKG